MFENNGCCLFLWSRCLNNHEFIKISVFLIIINNDYCLILSISHSFKILYHGINNYSVVIENVAYGT